MGGLREEEWGGGDKGRGGLRARDRRRRGRLTGVFAMLQKISLKGTTKIPYLVIDKGEFYNAN